MDICPYCSLPLGYSTGGCSNRDCTNFRLALGAKVICSLSGVIINTHDAHGISYDVRLENGEVITYVPEENVAER